GIYNVSHAALLRVHKPNDDWLFPGQLNEQIKEPEVNKWAAEQIMAHHGTKSNAMSKVPWKAGDKYWMSYKQVKDLNLLVPYLELLGFETIKELTDKGNGQLLQDDLQIFLGQVSCRDWGGDKLGGNLLKPHPKLDQPLTHLQLSCLAPFTPSLNTFSMGHPNPYSNCGPLMDGLGHSKHHSFLTVNPITHMVTLCDPENPDCVIIIHPLQIQLYLKYDLEVCQSHGNPQLAHACWLLPVC
ncbi:hypothetical protein J132_02623, partial [Termitomyces sp. J132]